MKITTASSNSVKVKKEKLRRSKLEKVKKKKNRARTAEDLIAAPRSSFDVAQLTTKLKKNKKHSPEEIQDLPSSSASQEKKIIKHKHKVNAEINGTASDAKHDSEDRSLSDEVEEDVEESETSDLFNEGTGQQLDFDIEAFPMEAGDKDGIVNMLTQIFLRADIDLAALADAVIAQAPFGIVIGPAEDQSDEDSENDVYGVLTIAELMSAKVDLSNYAKDVMEFLENKAKKFALQDFRRAFESAKTKRVGLFINERMLNFPTQIISPSFNSLRSDYEQLQEKYNNIVYVHKLRIADAESGSPNKNESSGEPAKKQKKMGKAEKKKLTRETLLSAETIYDNVEDEILTQLDEGEAYFFDYPVHTEIESSSKFHTVVKDGKSFKPYRRIVIMDSKRFKAFLDIVSTSF